MLSLYKAEWKCCLRQGRNSIQYLQEHGVMGRRFNSWWWKHPATSRSSLCCTTCVNKAVVCIILSMGWCI